MKARLIHKPSLSTFDARQLSEGKRQPVLSFFFDISFLWIVSFLENELHLLSAKFKFDNIPWLVSGYMVKAYKHIGVYYLSFLCHFTTGCLSHTLVNSTSSWKTPSGLQIHGLSFLTRSSLAHNSILLCVFLPLLLSHYTINIICKHVGTDFFFFLFFQILPKI